jgi:hypothetical protein
MKYVKNSIPLKGPSGGDNILTRADSEDIVRIKTKYKNG